MQPLSTGVLIEFDKLLTTQQWTEDARAHGFYFGIADA